MARKGTLGGFVGCLVFAAAVTGAFAGDSLYGKVTAIKSADLIVFDYGAGQYDVRIIGIEVPREGPVAVDANKFLTDLVLGKNVRIRMEGVVENDELEARLFTDDPVIGIKDVGVELVRVGLARAKPEVDEYKYGELEAAEKEARSAKRGLWAATPQ